MNKCGNCEFAKYNGTDYICENEESEMYGLETDYDESCTEHEAKRSGDDDCQNDCSERRPVSGFDDDYIRITIEIQRESNNNRFLDYDTRLYAKWNIFDIQILN